VGTRHDLPGATFGPRRQFSWELVWMRAGALDLEIDERRLRLRAGDVAIVPPGAVDRSEWSGERRIVHSFVHFDVGAATKGWPPRERWPGLYARTERDFLQYVLDALTALPTDRPHLWTIVGVPMLELALRVLLVGPSLPAAPQAALPPCVDRALDWMRARLAGDEAVDSFSLADVARAARVDQAHLCRAFRSHLDVTPMQCVRLMRLDRAVGRLERSDDAIKEIAETTGFANAFHFSRCFSAAFRITPTRYREDFRRGVVHRLVTPALERLAAQRIVMNEPALSRAHRRAGPVESPTGGHAIQPRPDVGLRHEHATGGVDAVQRDRQHLRARHGGRLRSDGDAPGPDEAGDGLPEPDGRRQPGRHARILR
jgi:AraC-like DNA-binding protein